MARGVSNGTIIRVPRRDNFTIMSNVHLRDPNLTWKARGLMSTMLSFPTDWDFSIAGLAACAKDSLSATKSGLIELEDNGYLHRIQHRKPDGTWSAMEFQLYEDPAQNPYFKKETISETDEKSVSKNTTNRKSKKKTFENNVDTSVDPVVDFPPAVNPSAVNPSAEKPSAENRTQLNTQEIKNSSNQKLNQSINPEPDDGLMDREAELPENLVDTLEAIGFNDGYHRDSDQELTQEIIQNALDSNALKACRIPYSFAKSKPAAERAIRLVSCFDRYRTSDPFDPMIGIISALASMATTKTSKYNKRTVSDRQVIDKINERIASDGCLMDWLLSFQTRWEEIYEERKDTITHRSAYLKSCLWKWLEDSDAETMTDILIL